MHLTAQTTAFQFTDKQHRYSETTAFRDEQQRSSLLGEQTGETKTNLKDQSIHKIY